MVQTSLKYQENPTEYFIYRPLLHIIANRPPCSILLEFYLLFSFPSLLFQRFECIFLNPVQSKPETSVFKWHTAKRPGQVTFLV